MRLFFKLLLLVGATKHALVEHGHCPLDQRQESLLEGQVVADGPLNLEEIDNVITEQTVLVVLLIKFGHVFEQCTIYRHLQIWKVLQIQTVNIKASGLLRVNLAIVSDGLYGYMHSVLVAQ